MQKARGPALEVDPSLKKFCSNCNFPGAFDDDDVIHVEDDVNPVRDLEIISEELRKKVTYYTTRSSQQA